MTKVKCNACGFEAHPDKFKKYNMGMYHDLRCPKCNSTDINTSEIKKSASDYSYGDNNCLSIPLIQNFVTEKTNFAMNAAKNIESNCIQFVTEGNCVINRVGLDVNQAVLYIQSAIDKETEKLKSAIQVALSKDNVLDYLCKGECTCDPDVGHQCVECSIQDVRSILRKAVEEKL